MNLITSCKDCNSGKRAVPLSINETLDKQRIQMEFLQEQREQLKMLLEWKNSLDNYDDYKNNEIVQHIESKIIPYTMNENYKAKFLKAFNKYGLEKIIEASDISRKQYLRWDENGKLTKDSVNEYLGKMLGVLFNKNLPPIQQKLAYIKGICRNRFDYWDNQSGSIILNNYVDALKRQNWTDADILKDLDDEVIRITKQTSNWSGWRNTIGRWINDINSWE